MKGQERSELSEFREKVALVTGAGRGIGKAVALSLATAGCKVVLTARTESQLKDVEHEIQSRGGKAMVVVADLTQDHEVAQLVQECQRAWDGVDILVNNAGWGKRAPVARADIKDWDRTFGLNLRAPMILAKMLLPYMIAKNDGAIINIGSVSGKTGEADGAAYAASKFGLIGFTQSLYEEAREYGIKVSVLLPGFVNTPMIPPVKHLDRNRMIQPADVAEAVLFVLRSPSTSCPVEITIRPQRTPYNK